MDAATRTTAAVGASASGALRVQSHPRVSVTPARRTPVAIGQPSTINHPNDPLATTTKRDRHRDEVMNETKENTQ
jgi:hypothetical protein